MGSPLVIPFLLFLIPLIFFVSLLSVASSLCQNDQSLALLQFKQSFNITTEDPFELCASYSYGDQNSYPRTSSWNSSIDCCLWDGVTCDELSGQVIELDLSCSLLVGTIDSNSSLFHLSHLTKLNLAFNHFSQSPISHRFGDFSYLTHLNLSQSFFSGQIPTNVLRLPNLVSLDLSWNFDLILEPQNFKFLLQNSTLQIREILLDNINIDSMIPPNLSSHITTLSLSATGLRGSLPSTIFHLPNLNRLILSSNENLTVHFPSTTWNNSLSITDLDLGNTICSPNIVESLVNLSSVKHLGLANCGLSGNVSETILSLKQLTTLDLSENNLEGGFADVFTRLWRLKQLRLHDNNIVGQFPSSITNITQLEVLIVSNNSLYGTLPSWFFNSSTLYRLDLRYNRLQGSIPSSLSTNKNLFFLLLSSNNFSGTVEVTMFSNLKRLWYLDLSNNLLSIVPTSEINSTSWYGDLEYLRLSSCNLMNLSFLRDLKSLWTLDLSNNKIQGRIPEWAWSNWRGNLGYLNLSHNYLTSVEGIQQLHSLEVIDLRFNLLEGPLPTLPTYLSYFFASQNNLSGEIPLTLCNLSSVQIMDLANNSLSGAIPPQCLGNSSNLEVLDIHNNELRGSIPSNFLAGKQRLHTLNLRENKLEGRIPRSLANCTNLEVLDIGRNNLSDVFPEWLVILPKLQVLSLRSNNFHGTITTSSTAKNLSSQLKIIDLSHNDFSGNLPVWLFNTLTALQNTDEEFEKSRSYFGDQNNYYKDSLVMVMKGNELQYERVLTVLTTIDLSSNNFEGNIPGVIGQLLSLQGLNLSHNMLCARIPHSLGDLSQLESLDLSSNQLVGKIPNELASLTFLEVLNLSHNHLTGCIPKGTQLNTFGNDSYEGNEGLLGFPMSKDCGNGGRSPQPHTLEMIPQEEEDNNESIIDEGFSWKDVLLGYGCGIVFGLVVGSIMLLIQKPYWLTRIVEEEAYRIMMKAKRKRTNTPRSGRRRRSR